MRDAVEINRLKELLAGRKVEYEVFGATSEDKQEDVLINNKIKKLELE